MNKIAFILCLLMVSIPTWGQDPTEPIQPPPLPEEMDSEMGPPPPFVDSPEASFVDQWLDHLKEKDPDEYARLQKLRETSPDEFRQALHEKLKQERSRYQLGRHNRPPISPEIAQLEKETMDISIQYRQTTDSNQKEKIREELRQKIETLFDLREKNRQEHIRRIEADLTHLKKSVQERQAHRDEIIERRLQELTDADGLKW